MKYYTVRVTPLKSGQKDRIFSGVKAKSTYDAIEKIRTSNKLGVCEMTSWLSKHRRRNLHSLAWSEGRNRHESRTQHRSAWAVLAKREAKGRVDTDKDYMLNHLLIMQHFGDSWKAEQGRPKITFPEGSDLFGVFKDPAAPQEPYHVGTP